MCRPGPRWGSLQRSPNPLAGFRGRPPGKERANGWERKGQMEGVVEGGRNRRGYNIKEWRGGTGTPLGGVSILQGGMEGPALHRYP